MKYIYDILLNFKDELFDFYEWNKNDNIIHIRKIPIIKIKSTDLLNIKNNVVEINNNFLEQIKDKTEYFTKGNKKKIEYAFLLTDGKTIIALNKTDKGLKYSSLLIDEEIDTLIEIEDLNENNIEYRIIKNKYIELKTRKEKETKSYLKKELIKIENKNELLKYLYYECFDKKEERKEKILLDLYESLDNNKISNKLFNFFKLLQLNK